jgi:bacteriocin biosynthesis cyclodehydratase domain-containing protein
VADPIRLIEAEAASPRIMVGGIGDFGVRVASFLSAWLPAAREFGAADGIEAAFAAEATAVVLALWRPEPGLCEIADELSFRRLVPWLPVIMEHPVIRVGPLVEPMTRPCFRCYARRRAQHDLQPWVTAALLARYRQDPAWGPAGYLPHHARMAAAVAAGALSDRAPAHRSRDESRMDGEVTTIGLATDGLQTNRVIACHNCDRCLALGSHVTKPSARLARLSELAASARQAGMSGFHGHAARSVGSH